MSVNCNCPICRYYRGEITFNEVTWYLKGKIEARNSDLIIYETKNYAPFNSYRTRLKVDLDFDECALSNLIYNNKGVKIDFALTHPRRFIPTQDECNSNKDCLISIGNFTWSITQG